VLGTLLEGRKMCGKHVGQCKSIWATFTIGKGVTNINKVDKKEFTIISVGSISNL
jgi:hypothetical protein